MELRHLRYYVAVAELLHFGRAAAQLQITQPSLSHQIRQLETELQAKLLERTKRTVRLTESGRVFLERAHEILALADRASLVARAASVGEGNSLRIGCALWMRMPSFVRVVMQMRKRAPATRLQIRTMSVPLQLAALRDDELDVGFVRPPVAQRSLSIQTLVREPLVVALPSGHRLRGSGPVRLSALAGEPFILFPRPSVPHYYDLTLRICRDAGFVPHVRQEADHPDLLLRFVAAGLGISLVPAWVESMRPRGVAFRAIDSLPHVLETAVAWPPNPSPPLKTFLEVVFAVFGVAEPADRAEQA